MKKMLIFMLICFGVFLFSCSNRATTKSDALDTFLSKVKHANIIEWNSFSETKTSLDDKIYERNSFANLTLKRSPYASNSLSISHEGKGNLFLREVQRINRKGELGLSLFFSEINQTDYDIDDEGHIALSKAFAEGIKMPPMENYPAGMIGWRDPFSILVYLIESDYSSFQQVMDEQDIIYQGYLSPDAVVDYYTTDGKLLFDQFFPDYRGVMTQQAIRAEIIAQNYRILAPDFIELIFTEKPIPITIKKENKTDKYSITIDLTDAWQGLNDVMYAHEESIHVDVEKHIWKISQLTFSKV